MALRSLRTKLRQKKKSLFKRIACLLHICDIFVTPSYHNASVGFTESLHVGERKLAPYLQLCSDSDVHAHPGLLCDFSLTQKTAFA